MRGWAYAVVGLVACSPRGVTVGGDDAQTETGASTDPGWDDESSGTGMVADLPGECLSWVRFESSVSHLAWVVEQSSAMRQHEFDHDGSDQTPDQTPWQVTLDFLQEVGDQLGNREPCGADVETSFSFAPALGAQPIPDASACQTDDPPPLAFNRDLEISNLIELADASGNGGANPLAKAHAAAVERLLEDSHGEGDYVVLVAHSPGNCGQDGDFETLDGALMASIADAFQDLGIVTYVIGVGVDTWVPDDDDDVPNADATAYFDALAQAGGRPSFEAHDYWEPDKSIIYEFKTGGGSTCIVPIDPPPPDGIDEADLEVLVNGTKVEFVTDCATEDGWIWINEYDTIQICGEECPLWDDDCHAAPPHVVADVKVRWTCP